MSIWTHTMFARVYRNISINAINFDVCFLYWDRSLLEFMTAPNENLRRRVYNVTAMSFTPEELVQKLTKYVPELRVTYKPDTRQNIGKWAALVHSFASTSMHIFIGMVRQFQYVLVLGTHGREMGCGAQHIHKLMICGSLHSLFGICDHIYVIRSFHFSWFMATSIRRFRSTWGLELETQIWFGQTGRPHGARCARKLYQ